MDLKRVLLRNLQTALPQTVHKRIFIDFLTAPIALVTVNREPCLANRIT